MKKPTWLKVTMGIGGVAAATIGGLSLGPLGAIGAGLAAGLAALGGLYHEPPKPRPRKDKRGQIADAEDPR